MISFFLRMLNIIPNTAKNRFFNRYTTHGSLLLGYAAVQAGVLPQGALELIDGVPNMHIWIPLAIAFFLIMDKGLPALSRGISRFIPNKQEQLEEMKIETLILEEKVKQEKLKKELNLIKDKKNETN